MKPRIRILWSTMTDSHMKSLGFSRQQPIYRMQTEHGAYSTGNPNDLLCAIICYDIGNTWDEEQTLMQSGNKSLVWNGNDWERVIGAPLPKWPSLDPRDNPTPPL